jgi:gamma-glutamylaminecyclotransferase
VGVDVLVFVYGTLKRGYSNNRLLQGCKYLGEATTEALYLLYDYGPFPCMVRAKEGKHIKGEIWEVDEKVLKRLDVLEGVEHGFYKRARIKLINNDKPVWGYLYLGDTSSMPEIGNVWKGNFHA